MNKETLRKGEEFLRALEIADQIISRSTLHSEHDKEHMLTFHIQNKQIVNNLLEEGKLTSYGLKSLVNAFLIYWNESVTPDTEMFWKQIRENGISYKRKEPLRRVLQIGRFRNVHESMQAAKNFASLVDANLLVPGYSKEEVKSISDIIQHDIKERVRLLKDCLQKNAIPAAMYLRFGDSIAYMNECSLWNNYFADSEVQRLMEIWRNFK